MDTRRHCHCAHQTRPVVSSRQSHTCTQRHVMDGCDSCVATGWHAPRNTKFVRAKTNPSSWQKKNRDTGRGRRDSDFHSERAHISRLCSFLNQLSKSGPSGRSKSEELYLSGLALALPAGRPLYICRYSCTCNSTNARKVSGV